jgi:hypothetical protein
MVRPCWGEFCAKLLTLGRHLGGLPTLSTSPALRQNETGSGLDVRVVVKDGVQQ